jgi:hypothetical protein
VIAGVRYARIFWIGAAGAVVLAALIGISALLRSDFTETDGQILLTLLALLVSSGTGVAGLTVAERGFEIVGWGAVTVATLSFFFIATATWSGFDDDTLNRMAGTAAIALIATLLATTQLVLHRGRLGWVVFVTWTALLLAFSTTAAGLWQDNAGDGLWKGAGSCWIVGVMAWILLPVLQRFAAAAVVSSEPEARVLATLEGVQLVLTRSSDGLEVVLAPGERLALRLNPKR